MTHNTPLFKFKDQISALNPMAFGDTFNYERWENGFTYDKGLVRLFKNYDKKEITRFDVISSFREFFDKKIQNHFAPFLLSMIWGYGTRGYGPHRTNKYFSKENITHIEKAMSLLSSKAMYEAHAELLLVKGLNVSFASKITYFAGRALSLKEYPLIFDNRVANSLVNIFIDSDITETISVNPKTDLESYKKYNILIHKWAKEINVEADKIEFFLFNGIQK